MEVESTIKKVVFVCNGHDAMLIRWAISTLADAVSKLGIVTKTIDLAKGGNERECDGADIVVVYRSFDYRTTRLMRRVRIAGSRVIFFLDDYLFQPNCQYSGGWVAPLDFITESDFLMSSSKVLLSKMVSDKPKILRRSVLSEEVTRVLIQGYRRDSSKFSIGWVAGKGRFGMMDLFISNILRELSEGMVEGERCDFHCFGSRLFPSFTNVETHEHLYYKPEDWRGLYSKIVSFDLGVMINPLEETDEFHHTKSELKFVESGTMGVPLVTSRIPPYTEILKENETGFFASTPREFAEKILKVMRNEKLSRYVSENAKNMVREKYDVMINAQKFIDDIMDAVRKVGSKV